MKTFHDYLVTTGLDTTIKPRGNSRFGKFLKTAREFEFSAVDFEFFQAVDLIKAAGPEQRYTFSVDCSPFNEVLWKNEDGTPVYNGRVEPGAGYTRRIGNMNQHLIFYHLVTGDLGDKTAEVVFDRAVFGSGLKFQNNLYGTFGVLDRSGNEFIHPRMGEQFNREYACWLEDKK